MHVSAADNPSKLTTITATRALPSMWSERACCVVSEGDADAEFEPDMEGGAEVDTDKVIGLLDVVLVADITEVSG